MGQNGHANVLVMRKSKNTITVVKKAHTIKNLVLGGLHTRKVNYLSQTYAGKRHDKKIADEESPTYPEDISLYKDTGFQGYEPEGGEDVSASEEAQRERTYIRTERAKQPH